MQRNGTQRFAATRRFAQRTRGAKCAEGRAPRGACEHGAQLVAARCVPVSLLEQMTSFFPNFPGFSFFSILINRPKKEMKRKISCETIPQQQ